MRTKKVSTSPASALVIPVMLVLRQSVHKRRLKKLLGHNHDHFAPSYHAKPNSVTKNGDVFSFSFHFPLLSLLFSKSNGNAPVNIILLFGGFKFKIRY